jgi:ATP-dependent Clp protease ATP-binding subunit ClpB
MDKAIITAVTLSNRYITDRFLPDKAIDLIDEAASSRRMEIDSKPDKIDVLDRKIIQLKIEYEAIKKEPNNLNKERSKQLEDELANLQKASDCLTKHWQAEKSILRDTQKLQEILESARHDLDVAQRTSNYEKAGKLLYGVIPELKNKIRSFKNRSPQTIVKEEVTSNDIASIVSRWTGIPLTKMMKKEQDKLLEMEDRIKEKVIGQSQAIKEVANAVRRARTGLQDPSKPIGSFIFLGPTGVGKTELSKAIAEFLFDNENSMFRIDMSEFMEKHSVARMIGAPPGYIGYEQGGVLTETVRRRPYQVLLFDEIEKAHPEVLNVLLQVLDDGRLTDGQGRTVDFRNTLIIMTSNIGTHHITSQPEGKTSDCMLTNVMNDVRQFLRPEFLNRLDDIILFSKLTRTDMEKIVEIQIKQLQSLLNDKGIKILLNKTAKKWLADAGYDPSYGARPLKRALQNFVQNPLAKNILEGTITEGNQILVGVENDNLLFKIEKTV